MLRPYDQDPEDKLEFDPEENRQFQNSGNKKNQDLFGKRKWSKITDAPTPKVNELHDQMSSMDQENIHFFD